MLLHYTLSTGSGGSMGWAVLLNSVQGANSRGEKAFQKSVCFRGNRSVALLVGHHSKQTVCWVVFVFDYGIGSFDNSSVIKLFDCC